MWRCVCVCVDVCLYVCVLVRDGNQRVCVRVCVCHLRVLSFLSAVLTCAHVRVCVFQFLSCVVVYCMLWFFVCSVCMCSSTCTLVRTSASNQRSEVICGKCGHFGRSSLCYQAFGEFRLGSNVRVRIKVRLRLG